MILTYWFWLDFCAWYLWWRNLWKRHDMWICSLWWLWRTEWKKKTITIYLISVHTIENLNEIWRSLLRYPLLDFVLAIFTWERFAILEKIWYFFQRLLRIAAFFFFFQYFGKKILNLSSPTSYCLLSSTRCLWSRLLLKQNLNQ